MQNEKLRYEVEVAKRDALKEARRLYRSELDQYKNQFARTERESLAAERARLEKMQMDIRDAERRMNWKFTAQQKLENPWMFHDTPCQSPEPSEDSGEEEWDDGGPRHDPWRPNSWDVQSNQTAAEEQRRSSKALPTATDRSSKALPAANNKRSSTALPQRNPNIDHKRLRKDLPPANKTAWAAQQSDDEDDEAYDEYDGGGNDPDPNDGGNSPNQSSNPPDPGKRNPKRKGVKTSDTSSNGSSDNDSDDSYSSRHSRSSRNSGGQGPGHGSRDSRDIRSSTTDSQGAGTSSYDSKQGRPIKKKGNSTGDVIVDALTQIAKSSGATSFVKPVVWDDFASKHQAQDFAKWLTSAPTISKKQRNNNIGEVCRMHMADWANRLWRCRNIDSMVWQEWSNIEMVKNIKQWSAWSPGAETQNDKVRQYAHYINTKWKRQVEKFIDIDNVETFESADIVRFLEPNYENLSHLPKDLDEAGIKSLLDSYWSELKKSNYNSVKEMYRWMRMEEKKGKIHSLKSFLSKCGQ
jgi:hypothetical protein